MLLKIAHVEDAHEPRYVVVREQASYLIGFEGGNDIVLADSTVAPRHARLTLEDGRIVVEPMLGNPVFVDEEPIRGPTEVVLAQWIQLGETVLQILRGDRPPPRNHDERRPPSDEEQGFLALLRKHPDDDECRVVYADWLEAAECPVTAGFIRLELAGGADIATSELVERATRITSHEWRALVCRGPIGNCDRGGCPGRWHALVPRGEPLVRDCTTCGEAVHYCHADETVARLGEQRARVVFDAALSGRNATEVYFFGIYRDRGDLRETPPLFRRLDPEQHEPTYDRGLDTEVDDDDLF